MENTGKSEGKVKAFKGLLSENLKPRKHLQPLLQKLATLEPPPIQYIGTSFGITEQLHNFWSKSGFLPLYIRQSASEVTGEYSTIMMRPVGEGAWLQPYLADFRARFLQLISYAFRGFPPALCLFIIDCVKGTPADCDLEEIKAAISLHDLKRLESYSKSLVDYHLILDLVPKIAMLYF